MIEKVNYLGRKKYKLMICLVISIFILFAGVTVGSAGISFSDVINILLNKTIGTSLEKNITDVNVSIIWNIRFPRVIMAFAVGGALGMSGVVMQSVLRNPLASSYTLGVSSGASLGAAIVIISGITIPFVNQLTLPIVGFIFGLATVLFAMKLSLKFDRNMENQTIILVGMVLSLFVNSILTLVTTLSQEHLEQLVFWQLGSFSGSNWEKILIIVTVCIIGVVFLLKYSREMDTVTLGEEEALSIGVEVKKVKTTLIVIAAFLTGSAVSLVGTIGFVDLIAPHVVRKFFGSSHKWVVPMSFILGGCLMVLADLFSRTLLAPRGLPVGAITSLIGAPFFAYIYFGRKK
ncbi:MAG: iron ABC transporter permease [Clostridioides sp.]|nr:iron ABC transporter permease [Clostridioides sp.]